MVDERCVTTVSRGREEGRQKRKVNVQVDRTAHIDFCRAWSEVWRTAEWRVVSDNFDDLVICILLR